MSGKVGQTNSDTTRLAILGSTGPDILKLISARNKTDSGELVVVGFLDDDPSRHGQTFMGHKVLGGSELIGGELQDALIINNVAKTTAIRHKVWERVQALGGRFYSAIHPSVDVSFAAIGEGVIIQEGVILGPGAKVGHQSIVNFGTIIAHESTVDECCFLAPGVTLNGRITVRKGAFLGAGAIIMPHITVGEWSMVGAGSVVTDNVPPYSTVFGSPARVIAYRPPEEVS